ARTSRGTRCRDAVQFAAFGTNTARPARTFRRVRSRYAPHKLAIVIGAAGAGARAACFARRYELACFWAAGFRERSPRTVFDSGQHPVTLTEPGDAAFLQEQDLVRSRQGGGSMSDDDKGHPRLFELKDRLGESRLSGLVEIGVWFI